MSRKPGPSSSTRTTVLVREGAISTSQTVAAGASSQAFWTNSFTRLQGFLPEWSSRSPSVDTENRSWVILSLRNVSCSAGFWPASLRQLLDPVRHPFVVVFQQLLVGVPADLMLPLPGLGGPVDQPLVLGRQLPFP